jgi:predicted nuclease of predicted toxin-antitoxin system
VKLLLDQGLPRSAVNLLRGHGIDAIHVGDVGLAEASDEEILAEAVRDERVIVTLDADFHAILARTKARAPSAVRIRMEGLTATPLTSVILEVLEKCTRDLELGAVVSVTARSIRIRMLPLV